MLCAAAVLSFRPRTHPPFPGGALLGAVLAAALISSPAAPAQADDARGGAGFILYSLQLVLPNELGTDVAVAPGAKPRFLLVWSGQIPFGIFSDWSASDSERTAPLMHHRLVYEVGALFGRERDPSSHVVDPVTVDFRFGYRYRFWHMHAVAPFVGAGTTIEPITSGARASLSPEIGLHVGRRQIVFPGFQLRLQADFYPSLAPHTRSLVTVGYTFF